jgi:hypothetical protein
MAALSPASKNSLSEFAPHPRALPYRQRPGVKNSFCLQASPHHLLPVPHQAPTSIQDHRRRPTKLADREDHLVTNFPSNYSHRFAGNFFFGWARMREGVRIHLLCLVMVDPARLVLA